MANHVSTLTHKLQVVGSRIQVHSFVLVQAHAGVGGHAVTVFCVVGVSAPGDNIILRMSLNIYHSMCSGIMV